MIHSTTNESTDAGGHRSVAFRRGAVVVGWSLLGAFALIAATIGRIGENVRLFEVAYAGAFLGYLALVWVVVSGDRRSSGGRWWLWLIGCVVIRLPLLGMEPSDDAYRYVWEGRVQLAGFNPYAHAPDDPLLSDLRNEDWSRINHPDYPAIYPPVTQAEFALAAALRPSIFFVKALHVLWDILAVVVVASVLRRRGRSPHLAIVYGLCPLTLTAFAIDGHLDSLMLLTVALTTWAIATKRIAMAAVMLGLAMGSKLIPIVLLPWFVLRHFRAAMLAMFVFACTFMPYLAAGPELFESFGRFSGVEFFSLLGTFGVTHYETMVVRVVVGGLVVLISFTLARWREDFPSFAASAVAALILFMPVMHYWYIGFVLLFLPFGIRARWLVMSFFLVVYFEATRHQELTGDWTMPLWANKLVWGAFLLTWLVEWWVSRRASYRGNGVLQSPSDGIMSHWAD